MLRPERRCWCNPGVIKDEIRCIIPDRAVIVDPAAAGLKMSSAVIVRRIGSMIVLTRVAKVALFTVALSTVSLLLPPGSLSQAERATLQITSQITSQTAASQIKKPLIYQIGTVVRINADGPQPLLRALEALEEEYGWVVDYEDPQLPDPSGEATNPGSVPQRRHANAQVVGAESFTVEFKSGATPDSVPDEDAVLAAVVDAYNEANGDVQFELRIAKRQEAAKQEDKRFAVVGVAVRGPHDVVLSQTPILDLPITLARERRSAEQTITLICEKVSEQSKIPVTPMLAGNFLSGKVLSGNRERGTIAVGGNEAPARTLLSLTLASMKGRPHWRLLYETRSKSYQLNVTGPGRE
jgi:hypothetical protein